MKGNFPLSILLLSTVLIFSGCGGEEDDPANVPTIFTNEISSITGTTAMSGGEISSSGCDSNNSNSNSSKCQITAKGVCWSTEPLPTVNLATKTDSGPGFHNFDSNITGLTVGITYYVRAYATNGVGTAYGQEVSFKTEAVVGDEFQGGILAFLYPGTPRHGIICSKEDFGELPWSNTNSNTGATATAVGSGQNNTALIIANQGAGNYAAKICADLVVGDYNDWFLPSRDELDLLLNNKDAIGNFGTQYYWSSSELDNSSALRTDFLSGTIINNGKSNTHAFRPIRIF